MPITRVNALALNAGETPSGTWTGVDEVNNILYGVVATTKLVKVDVSVSPPTRIGILDLGITITDVSADFTNGILYITGYTGTIANTYVKRIALSTFTVTHTISFSTLLSVYSASLQPRITHYSSYVYIITPLYISYGGYLCVIKLNIADLTQVTYNNLGYLYYYSTINDIIIDVGNSLILTSLDTTINRIRISDFANIGNISVGVAMSNLILYNDKLYGLDGPDPAGLKMYRVNSPGFGGLTTLSISALEPRCLIKDPYSNRAYIISAEGITIICVIDIEAFTEIETIVLPAGDDSATVLAVKGSASAATAKLWIIDATAPSDVIYLTDTYIEVFPSITAECSSTVGVINVTGISTTRGCEGIRISYKLNPEDAWIVLSTVLGVTELAYAHAVNDETPYYYLVEQKVGGAWSTLIAETSIICAWHPWSPCKPENIKGTLYNPTLPIGQQFIGITWDYSITGLCGQTVNWVDGFKIYRKKSTESVYTLNGTVNFNIRAHYDASLEVDTIYEYYVVAYNSHRASNISKIISIET